MNTKDILQIVQDNKTQIINYLDNVALEMDGDYTDAEGLVTAFDEEYMVGLMMDMVCFDAIEYPDDVKLFISLGLIIHDMLFGAGTHL